MGNGAILLVEDDPGDAALALRAFEKNKITNRVVIARDGAEALDYFFSPRCDGVFSGELPELILMDLKLPKIGGLEVLEKLRNHPRTKLLPVVIMTSSTEDKDLCAGYKLGANSYIRKPVDYVRFSDTIRQLVSYWLSLNEPPPDKKGYEKGPSCTDN